MSRILVEKLSSQWILVTDLNIVDYQFSDEFNVAIEQKVKAEQEALTEKNRLEKIKFQAEQQVESARWAADAQLLKAQAEAEAIRIKTEAIKAQGWAEYVQLQRIDKRNGTLPQTSLGNSMPVILDLSSSVQ